MQCHLPMQRSHVRHTRGIRGAPDRFVAERRLIDCSELERAIQAIQAHGQSVDKNLLQHRSPLSWEHISLTGDYVWRQSRKIEKGKYGPFSSSPKA
jgi:hypothetical protein